MLHTSSSIVNNTLINKEGFMFVYSILKNLKKMFGKFFDNSNSSVPCGSESVVMNPSTVVQKAATKSNRPNKSTRKEVFIPLKKARDNLGKIPNGNTLCFLDEKMTRKPESLLAKLKQKFQII
jgi:hypothetical protein